MGNYYPRMLYRELGNSFKTWSRSYGKSVAESTKHENSKGSSCSPLPSLIMCLTEIVEPCCQTKNLLSLIPYFEAKHKTLKLWAAWYMIPYDLLAKQKNIFISHSECKGAIQRSTTALHTNKSTHSICLKCPENLFNS